MKKEVNIEKLKSLIKHKTNNRWEESAKWHEENHEALELITKFAIQLHLYLKKYRISQADLAKKMGVSPQYVSRIIKGRENLTFSTVQKIHDALGVKFIDVIENSKTADRVAPQKSTQSYTIVSLHQNIDTNQILDTNALAAHGLISAFRKGGLTHVEPAKC